MHNNVSYQLSFILLSIINTFNNKYFLYLLGSRCLCNLLRNRYSEKKFLTNYLQNTKVYQISYASTIFLYR